MRNFYFDSSTYTDFPQSNSLQKHPVDEMMLVEFYERYAPSTRTAFQEASNPQYHEARVQNALERLSFSTLPGMFMDATAHHMRLEISHSIIRFDPDENRGPLISIASRHIFDRIDTLVMYKQWHVCDLIQKQARTLVHLSSASGPGLSPSYMIFDVNTKSVEIRSKPAAELGLAPVERYDVGDQNLALCSTKCYYQPAQRH